MTDLATANNLSAPELATLLAQGMTPAELPRGFVRREARLAEAYELMLKQAGNPAILARARRPEPKVEPIRFAWCPTATKGVRKTRRIRERKEAA